MTPQLSSLVAQLEGIQNKAELDLWKKDHALSTDLLESLWARQQNLLASDPKAALRLSEWMILIATDLGHSSQQATALRAKGNALVSMDDYIPALEYFEAALKIFRTLGEELEIARTMMNRMVACLRLSRFDEALLDADIVTGMFKRLGDDRRLGAHLVNVGNIYFRLDRFAEHLETLDQAEVLLTRVDDRPWLCRVHLNRAVTLTSLNRADEALRCYETARRLASASELPLLVSQCDYNICYLYFLQGQYTKALEMLNAVRKHMNECGDRWHSALCNLDQSEIYLELNMHHDAIELAEEAYKGFDAIGMAYEMAKAVTFTGIAHSHLRQYDKALDLFDRSRVMFKQQGNEVWLSLIDLYQGIVCLQTGRHSQGLDLARKAHVFFSSAGLQTKAIYAQLLVARLEVQSGHLDRAWAEAQAASETLGERPAPWLRYQVEHVVGEILQRQGQLENARLSFRRSVRELETLRTNIHVDELRMTFLKDKLKVYEALVRCALEIGDPASICEAFEAVEHAKSRTLVDLLENNINAVHPNRESDKELVESVKTIREELNWYYRRLNIAEQEIAPGADPKVNALIEEVRKRENQLIRLLRQVSAEPSEYVTLQRVVTASLEEIQAGLPDDTVLIEFYVVDDRVIAFAIARDGLRVFRHVAEEAEIRKHFDLLRFQLTKFNLGAAYLKEFGRMLLTSVREHLHDLYSELIPPIQSALRGRRAIIFVPHGILHYLPFHALFDGERYLIDDYEISYAPSATICRSCASGNATVTGAPLIIGVPDARAPEILDEVNNVASVFGNATVLVGPEATAARVAELAASAGIVHIASHGSFRKDNPMFSSIQLGDTWLSLFDVYNLKTSADLVTLSGCGTGMSKIIGGDEVVGLVRGFLYSGARSLVVSLWDVHDRTTADLMKAFYGHLASGETRWSSLRQAVLALKEARPHPFYWAPFIGIGGP